MTYSEAIQFLYNLRWFGTKLGLDNTLRLAELAGNPHHRLRFIHVAGTNGKGSTCAMLESIYRAAGLRTGLFTSPHLIAFGERIQVDRHPISEAEVVKLVAEMRELLSHFSADEHPTFFEVVTVMALLHFAQQQCDLVVWETGLGGRLDATNIVTPLACVITNVQFDHEKWLGPTLAAIASEKAGIIKPSIPVLTAADEAEPLRVIEETARSRQAPLTIVKPPAMFEPPLDALELPLLGEHQRLNAALAVATVRVLAAKLPVSDEALRAGLTKVRWPGRFELITRPSGHKVLLDGAHNAAGARALAAALRATFTDTKPALILGILQDKDWAGMARILAPLARRIFLTTVSSERTVAPEQLLAVCRAANPTAEAQVCNSPAAAFAQAETEAFILVTGSLYLVGEALEFFCSGSEAAVGERALNEWGMEKTQNPKSKIQKTPKIQR